MAESAEQRYLTQRELAKRWRTSQSCVKNWRDRGLVPYFRLPESSRVLYPVDGIEEVEQKYTKPLKGGGTERKPVEIKRKKPGISAKFEEDWRI